MSEDGTTDSTDTRWAYTNDLLAIYLVVTFPVTAWLDMTGYVNLETLPASVFTLYASFVGIALAWAFGPEAVKAWREEQ